MLLATQWQPPEPSSSLKWLQRAATSGSEEAAALLEVLDDGTAAME
jgi:hypothetical protein